MRRPAMAITTVVPANSTALPAVALARPTDSTTERPSCRNAAVAGDDEQGVVDADAEADHRGQHRRHRRHLGQAGHDPDDRRVR